MDKNKVLECFIALEKEKIDEIKKSIYDKRNDLISFQNKDSLDNAKKIEYSIFLDNLKKSLNNHEEILFRMKTMELSSKENVNFGSLINIENIGTGDLATYFVMVVGGDSVETEGKTIHGMSLGAPFAQCLVDKKENDEVCFREMTFKVLSVY